MPEHQPELLPPEFAAALIRESPNGVLAFDRSFRYTVWNPAMERISGLAAGEVLGKEAVEVFPFLAETGEIANYRAVLTGERVVANNRPFQVPATGRTGIFDGLYFPVAAPDGTVSGGMVIVRDVTVERRADEALRLTEERFRAVLQGSSMGVALLDTAGRTILTNPALQRMLGLSEAEAAGVSFKEVTHPDDLENDLRLFQEMLRGNLTSGEVEKRYLRKDGSYFWAHLAVSLVRDEAGTPVFAVGLIQDISARKAAEDALRASEERYRSLVAVSTSIVWTTDARGRFIEEQPSWATYTGQTWKESVGFGWSQMIHPEDREPVLGVWKQALTTGQPCETEGRVWHAASGCHRHFQVRAVPIRHPDGTVREWVGTVTDVEERHRAEQAVAFLANAGGLLSSSLDYQATLDGVCRLVVPSLADWALIDVLEEGERKRVAVAHADPNMAAAAARLRTEPLAGAPAREVIRTGKTEFHPEITDALSDRLAGSPEQVQLLQALHLHSCICVPLRARGETLGAITFATGNSGRRFGPEDVSLAEELARRAALAIDHARLYAEAQETVRLHREAEESLTLLVQASSTLLASLDLDTVLPSILNLATQTIAADAYAFWRQDPGAGHWRLLSSTGLSPDYDRVLAPTGPSLTLQPMVIEDTEVDPLANARREAYRQEGIRALFVVPLSLHGALNATLVFYHREPRRFHPGERRIAVALGNLAAAAITSAELYREQQRIRQDAELARGRLLFIAEASTILANSLDYETTLNRLANLVVPRLADWCSIHLFRDDGSFNHAAVAHSDPEMVRWAWEMAERYPFDPDQKTGPPQIARDGVTVLLERITDEMLMESARDAEHLEQLRRLGFGACLIVPLRTQDRVLGTLTLVSAESGRHFSPQDVELAEELARRASAAIENAHLYDAVRRANDAKDAWLAMLAHELRNPLGAVRSALEVLSNPHAGAARQNRALGILDRQVRHQTQLVDDLLDVSRLIRGRVELRRARLDLRLLIQDAAEDYRSGLDAAGLALILELPAAPVWVEGDRTRLVQILSNLLTNAAKFTDAGGEVRISLEVRENAQVRLAVRDSGIGITRAMLPHIFEPFSQADQSLERTRGGLGLGLALVKGLTELHGGSVSVRSGGPGQGTEFVILLPQAEAPPAVQTAPEPSIQHSGPLRVLVVEDNRDVAESLRDVLELAGFTVETAYTGTAGLSAFEASTPDVILCDIGLPGLDGYGVARELSTRPERANLLLVAVTGYGQAEDRERTRAAGFDYHLVKPVNPATLERLLQSYAQGRTES